MPHTTEKPQRQERQLKDINREKTENKLTEQENTELHRDERNQNMQVIKNDSSQPKPEKDERPEYENTKEEERQRRQNEETNVTNENERRERPGTVEEDDDKEEEKEIL